MYVLTCHSRLRLRQHSLFELLKSIVTADVPDVPAVTPPEEIESEDLTMRRTLGVFGIVPPTMPGPDMSLERPLDGQDGRDGASADGASDAVAAELRPFLVCSTVPTSERSSGFCVFITLLLYSFLR